MNRRRFLTRAAASAALPLASSPMQAAAPTNAPAVPAGDPVGITPETIAAAERVAAVEFTADQRAPLARDLASRAAGYLDTRREPVSYTHLRAHET